MLTAATKRGPLATVWHRILMAVREMGRRDGRTATRAPAATTR